MNFLEKLLQGPQAKLFCSVEGEGDGDPTGDSQKKKEEAKKEEKPKEDEAAKILLEQERKKREQSEAELAKLRQENAESKKKLDEIEKKRLEEEGNYKGIADKESKRADEAVQQAQEIVAKANERMIVSELKAALAAEGCEDMDYWVLADKSKLSIKDDKVEGLAEVVEDLKTRKPHIFKGAKEQKKSAKGTPAPKGTVPDEKVNVKEMTPEKYREYKKNFVNKLRNLRAV